MRRSYQSLIIRVCLACGAGLLAAQVGCLFNKSRLASVGDPTREFRRKWQEKWQANQEWLRKKYTTEDHRVIIDRVFAQAFEQLNEPNSLLSSKTQVFILNSLPGTGKTQFVDDIARALDVPGGYSYKELGESDRFIDSTAFLQFAIDSQELQDPNYSVLPRIVMFDEYTHAVPLVGLSRPSLTTAL